MVKDVYQFKISLEEIAPKIWRRILVPESYSFWDLHVAIQDSMGWLDYHLHAFRFGKGHSRTVVEIGIPDEDGFGDIETLPGWNVLISEHFNIVGRSCIYEYDFGDGWVHEVTLEGIVLRERRHRYPRCLDGVGACPPEDCGGVGGYYQLLQVMSHSNNEEYKEMVEWLGGIYDPERFAPEKVKFDNPRKRWELVFSQGL